MHDYYLQLYPEDPLPKTVCIDCCAKLNQYFDFFETTSRAQLSLQMLFNPKMDKHEPKGEPTDVVAVAKLEPPDGCAGGGVRRAGDEDDDEEEDEDEDEDGAVGAGEEVCLW